MTLAALNTSPRDAFVSTLGGVFEHSPWIASAVADARPFASVATLHAAMMSAVDRADPALRLSLISAHPDLGTRLGRADPLTPFSAAEQAGAGLDRLDAAAFSEFTELNRAYRERFDMPFVIAVRGRTVADILDAFRARLRNDRAAEIATALAEIATIARLRLAALLEDRG